MDSLLPTIKESLPEPQFFVELRKKLNENKKRKSVASSSVNELVNEKTKVKKALLPTRIPPVYTEKKKTVKVDKKKEYMDNLKTKIKSMYKSNVTSPQEFYFKKTTKKPIISFPSSMKPITTTSPSLKDFLRKRILRIEDKYTGSQNRRIDDYDVEVNSENQMNHIEGDDYHDLADDQMALESFDVDSIIPVNKVLAKTDDVIYKQMSFWRNQFESERLFNLNESEIMTTTTTTTTTEITPTIKFENRKMRHKNNNDDISSEFYKSEVNPTKQSDINDWKPSNVEQLLTDELQEIQETLMAEDWTPLKEAPKILTNTPNIYHLSSHEVNDILKPVEKKRISHTKKRIYPTKSQEFPFLKEEKISMTSSPKPVEPFTISKVESSLKKPEINNRKIIPMNRIKNQDRYFLKSKPVMKIEDSSIKPYDYNVVSEVESPPDNEEKEEDDKSYEAQMRSMLDGLFEIADIKKSNTNNLPTKEYIDINRKPIDNEESKDEVPLTTTKKSDNYDDRDQLEIDDEDDVVPIYLHIPKSKGCPKFCISINVEITRAGRKINSKCRRSLLCNSRK